MQEDEMVNTLMDSLLASVSANVSRLSRDCLGMF